MDPEQVKDQMRKRMYHKQYDPADFYNETGRCQEIARSHWFENLTMIVILLNTFYIGYDTEANDHVLLARADLRFQVFANAFCLYFTVEILIRFFAFEQKSNAFKDGWFVFDSSLVFMMVFETWLMSFVVFVYGEEHASSFTVPPPAASMLRLVKFVRVVRFTRLARIFPELMVLLKGMWHALGSVFFTLVLLFMLAYIFAIAFTLFVHPDFDSSESFRSVGGSMMTLIVRGTLLDEVSDLIDALASDASKHNAWYLVPMLLVYVLLSALTVLNLLIGVMCEAVSAVADVNREENKLAAVKEMVQMAVVPRIPDGATTLSRDTFKLVLAEDESAMEAFEELGVDPLGLVDLTDFLFQQDPAACSRLTAANGGATFTAVEKEMKLEEFVELIMRLRSSNTATVKDLVETQKFFKHSMSLLSDSLRKTMRAEIAQVQMPAYQAPQPFSSSQGGTDEALAQMAARAADLERALAEAQRTFQDFARSATNGELSSEPAPPAEAPPPPPKGLRPPLGGAGANGGGRR